MGNCCSKQKDPIVPVAIEVNKDLVDIEEEKTRQFALALNIGKGPVKVEGKFRTGFETEKKIIYKRHPPEERSSSHDSVYEKIGFNAMELPPIPHGEGPPIRLTLRESSPISIPPRRNSK